MNILATTTIIGDIVINIVDTLAYPTVLLPVGVNPHSFEPNPGDIGKITEADLILKNGLGLEKFLDQLMENVGQHVPVINLSEDLIPLTKNHSTVEGQNNKHKHQGIDPHVWLDPHNIIHWLDKIETALLKYDKKNIKYYQLNILAYNKKLQALDMWIKKQVVPIKPENRKIVSDHLIFGYFAKRYHFKQIASLIPAFSTLAEPSAKEIAQIEDLIRQHNIKSILVGNTTNPALAEQVAHDTGIRITPFYTGSLGTKGSGAETYLRYMEYNVKALLSTID